MRKKVKRFFAFLLVLVMMMSVVGGSLLSVATETATSSNTASSAVGADQESPPDLEEIPPAQEEGDPDTEPVMTPTEEPEESGTGVSGPDAEQDVPEENAPMVFAAAAAKAPVSPQADSEEDRNFIVVQKTFVGITADQIPANFQVNVSSGSKTYTLTKNGAADIEFTEGTDKNGNITWRWKILDATVGTYQVTESNAEIGNYSLETAGTGSITVTAANMTVSVLQHETTCSHTNWPVGEGKFFAASLTQQGVVVITEHSLSAAQREKVKAAVLSINGPWKNPVYFYSIDEQNESGNGFETKGGYITYHSDTDEIIIDNPSQWQHVAVIEYDITQAENPEIGITNTYTRATSDLTIKKTVDGNMGDKNKDFSFTLAVTKDGQAYTETITDSNGNSLKVNENGVYTFKLKHDEQISLMLPAGCTLTVAETSVADDGYTTTVKVGENGTEETVSSKTLTLTENTTVLFTNSKTISAPTGVSHNAIPFVLMTVLALGGAASFVVLRKRRDGNAA